MRYDVRDLLFGGGGGCNRAVVLLLGGASPIAGPCIEGGTLDFAARCHQMVARPPGQVGGLSRAGQGRVGGLGLRGRG